jgi:YesN/AraC family two-component response regulator
MKTRVLIVDDEPIARRGIRRYLAKNNDIEIVGEAANGISTVEQINELRPDIVFLDVQMPDLDGFGVIENVEPSTGPAPVYIFVTAHDVHAIRAFEVHAVDYLLKPYDKERFAKVLVHALQVVEQRGKANRDLEPLLQSLRSLRPLERVWQPPQPCPESSLTHHSRSYASADRQESLRRVQAPLIASSSLQQGSGNFVECQELGRQGPVDVPSN